MTIINKLFLTVTTFAAEPLVKCDGTSQNPCDYDAFLLLIKNIFDYLVLIAVPAATAAIVWAGIMMITAGSNEGKRSQAKSIIWTAVLGLVVVLAAYLIVKTIFGALVTDPAYQNVF